MGCSHLPSDSFLNSTLLNLLAPPTYPTFIICNLDLTRVTKFDHGADGDIKFPTCFKVQPHVITLQQKKRILKGKAEESSTESRFERQRVQKETSRTHLLHDDHVSAAAHQGTKALKKEEEEEAKIIQEEPDSNRSSHNSKKLANTQAC